MNHELAYATIATVIPVLLVANVLGSDTPGSEYFSLRMRIYLRCFLTFVMLGELACLVALTLDKPPSWLLTLCVAAASTAVAFTFGAALAAFTPSPPVHRKRRGRTKKPTEDEGEHNL